MDHYNNYDHFHNFICPLQQILIFNVALKERLCTAQRTHNDNISSCSHSFCLDSPHSPCSKRIPFPSFGADPTNRLRTQLKSFCLQSSRASMLSSFSRPQGLQRTEELILSSLWSKARLPSRVLWLECVIFAALANRKHTLYKKYLQ